MFAGRPSGWALAHILVDSTFELLLWSPYGIGQTIIFLPCGFFFFYLSFFLALSQPLQIGCMPYFHTWCGLSANLECRSETFSLKTQDAKKSPKITIWAPSHNFVGYIFATKARIDNRKKNLLSSNMSCTCLHNMVNFGPLAAEIDPVV